MSKVPDLSRDCPLRVPGNENSLVPARGTTTSFGGSGVKCSGTLSGGQVTPCGYQGMRTAWYPQGAPLHLLEVRASNVLVPLAGTRGAGTSHFYGHSHSPTSTQAEGCESATTTTAA